ncbi:PIGA (GPI anchor biosynthesis) [Carpediemonas membranifera]|uniref:PIGA (GPI anchor biosynthesis) n=1 Tax=Carpediemonas membranifera TaxID=201153 RepID=A0A8J6E139_9EUKA|nr:PIGA (GPI anchor biosynthesis) [Carpediemonas membranifera]|eukprot:KAG9392606.1 PIGA (GPI anchor biosynthesis) [Carpediemonas membranifera]
MSVACLLTATLSFVSPSRIATSMTTPLTIAICSDAFYPSIGGVEHHILSIATELVRRGNRVIVLTMQYPGYSGIRYLDVSDPADSSIKKLIKVFYLPIKTYSLGMEGLKLSITSGFGSLALYRNIFLREGVEIIHGHQANSFVALEAVWIGNAMGLRTIFTDHSLIRMGSPLTVLTNKILSYALASTDRLIAVSAESGENTSLRSGRSRLPGSVHIIPNAVDSRFMPDRSKVSDPADVIRIVTVSRLSFRKGADLLIRAIRAILSDSTMPNVHFDVVGPGSEAYISQLTALGPCVTYHGGLPHDQVVNVLQSGHISLTTSLTEAFCIAVLEGAACGLEVVSTAVGGVVNVLPPDYITLCRLEKELSGVELVGGLKQTIARVHSLGGPGNAGKRDRRAAELHEFVRGNYSWPRVAEETETVYRLAMDQPRIGQWTRYMTVGGLVAAIVFFMCTMGISHVFSVMDSLW